MIPEKNSYRAFILIVLILPVLSFAQVTEVKTTRTLNELIVHLEKKYGVVFSFDAELVKDIPVAFDTAITSLPATLEDLNTKTAFIFQRLDRKNIIIKPKSPEGNFVVSGFITDLKTHEPLYSALVYSKTSKLNTACKEDGSFYKIIKYEPGDSVSFFLIGYERISVPVEKFAKGSLSVQMRSTFQELKEITVTTYLTSGIEYDAMDNSITMRPKNSSILPGQTNGDILMSLDALPGISSTDSKAGNLNIRGSTPDQTLIIFDNIPLYQKGHIFGTVSPFNANAVDNIKVQRSSMSANRGGRVGGIVEISSPNSVVNKPSATISSSLLDANIYAHTPVIKNKLSVFISARKSYPYSRDVPPMRAISGFIFQNSAVGGALKFDPEGVSKLDIGYEDANAKIIYNLTSKHKAIVSGLYSADNIAINLRDKRMAHLSQSTIDALNYGLSATISSNWSRKLSTQLSATNSFYSLHNQTSTFDFSNSPLTKSSYLNTVQDLKLFFEAQWKISERHLLKTGYDVSYYNTIYVRESNDTANVSYRQNYSNTGALHTLFVNWLSSPVDHFTIDAGVRVNYFTGNNQYSAEPRLVLGYKSSPSFRLKASGGYQKQFISQISGISIQSIGGVQSQLWMLTDNKNVPVVNSYQGTFGGLYQKNSWLFDVEGYLKQVSNVSNISISQPLSSQPFIQGSINIVGADLLLRKQWKRLDGWISYTCSKAMMKFDSVQRDPFISLYDQTHVFDIAFSYRIKQWKFSLAWKYRTGLAVLRGIRTRMIAGADSSPGGQQSGPPPPTSGGPPPPPRIDPNERFPAYHQLDASIQYNFPKVSKNWSGFIGVSVLNCYDQKNIIDRSMISIQGVNTPTNRYMMGRMFNLMISFSF